MGKRLNGRLATVVCASLAVIAGLANARAADPASSISITDPTPVAEQKPAVDGINFKLSAVGGIVGGYSNHMFLASVATPVPFASNFGAQLDFGIGKYRHDYTSAAAGIHLFWRDPDSGMLGLYADWGYINPEHAGRIGVEGALYLDRFSLDFLIAKQFGQHVVSKAVDEVDLSYYFTDSFKGSIGHRLTSRGHAGNIGFEYMPDIVRGWSIYGEAEIGEDDYESAWIGLRYSFGQSSASTLIERDRQADPIIRIPRNLVSVTRCGEIANPENYFKSWNGFETEMKDHLCADAEALSARGAIEGKL